MEIKGRVNLSDLRPISQEEFATARQICEKIRRTVESRAAYIQEHDLDPDIYFPGGAWREDTEIHKIYRFVVTAGYEVINRLRLHADIFTGYQLATFSQRRHEGTILSPIPDDYDREIEKIAPEPDLSVRRYIAFTRHLPREIIIKAPKILGEVGWEVDGGVANTDTYRYQQQMALLYETGIIDWLLRKAEQGAVNILDIGAGWGGLAYHLKHIIPEANFYAVDLPESLLFSSLYLAIACPEYPHTIYDGTDNSLPGKNDSGFKFIPNFMFDHLAAAKINFDLAINTASFQEMNAKQIRYYAQNLVNMLGDSGVLFERNIPATQDPSAVDDYLINCKLLLREFFKFRENLWWSFGGTTDIWANERLSGILRPSLKRKWQVFLATLSTREMALSMIGFTIRRIVGEKPYAVLVKFILSRPRLKSFLIR